MSYFPSFKKGLKSIILYFTHRKNLSSQTSWNIISTAYRITNIILGMNMVLNIYTALKRLPQYNSFEKLCGKYF